MPDRDWGIIGNRVAVELLHRNVATANLSHAYLFAGPSRTGRATAARRLAQTLNCLAPNSPCLTCDQCVRIEQGAHPDVATVGIEQSREGDSLKLIGVDQVRELSAQVSLSPYQGSWRIALIDPAELMSEAAQNALLITLEEPPPHVILVLVTEDEERLLPTVRSRCARVAFGLAPRDEIALALRTRGVTTEHSDLLARLSKGRPGWAITASLDAAFFDQRAEIADQSARLPELTLPERLALSEQLSEVFKRDRRRVISQVEAWQTWWRDVLLVQFGAARSVTNSDLAADLRACAERWDRQSVLRFIHALLECRTNLDANVQSRIALDSLLLDVPVSSSVS